MILIMFTMFFADVDDNGNNENNNMITMITMLMTMMPARMIDDSANAKKLFLFSSESYFINVLSVIDHIQRTDCSVISNIKFRIAELK